VKKPKKLYFTEDEHLGLGDAMEVKRALLLNAMDTPGGLDTALTAADQPIGQGAENLAGGEERNRSPQLN